MQFPGQSLPPPGLFSGLPGQGWTSLLSGAQDRFLLVMVMILTVMVFLVKDGLPIGQSSGSRSGIWLKSTILMEKPACVCPENDMDCVICMPALPSPFSVQNSQIPPKKCLPRNRNVWLSRTESPLAALPPPPPLFSLPTSLQVGAIFS